MNLIKSPMNYIGNKYNQLPILLDLFPNEINIFYDIFSGGGTVSLNVNSNKVYCNDIEYCVQNMFKDLKGKNCDECLNEIYNVIIKYNLNVDNKEGFLKLRNDYNNGNKEWFIFYVLTCFSFNNQFRFNSKHEYNSSFRKHKSCFTKTTELKFIKFMERLNSINIKFDTKDFRNVNYNAINKDDFVYFDPPYLISYSNYNNKNTGWNKYDDLDLMNICDELNDNNIKFAMSNMFMNNNEINSELINWSKKYNIHELEYKSNGSNYRRHNSKTLEILITNY